jgi:hypothetical protein
MKEKTNERMIRAKIRMMAKSDEMAEKNDAQSELNW